LARGGRARREVLPFLAVRLHDRLDLRLLRVGQAEACGNHAQRAEPAAHPALSAWKRTSGRGRILNTGICGCAHSERDHERADAEAEPSNCVGHWRVLLLSRWTDR